jgi:outer membrane receptor protein involved in Fe transport
VTNRNLLTATALQTGALILLASATPAFAQTTPPPQTPPEEETTTNSTQPSQVIQATEANKPATTDQSAITITGSRIRRPNLTSSVPVTSLQGEQFFQRGQTNIGDALNDLPQLRSTFAQQNPGLGIGIAGLNLLDLRGLGTVRTLTLVNGRRHVAADILNNAVSVDISSIPADLIDRVDIVTGANSSVYGSDAIAGVVNFILKRDYDGIQVRAQGATTEHNYGQNYYASVLAGKNFLGDRANITLHAEYAHQDRIFASDIPWLRQNDALGVVDVDANLPADAHGSDGFADRTFIRDIRQTSIAYTSLIPITQPASNPLCGLGLLANNGPPSNAGLPYNCTYLFNEAGDLAQQTGTRFSTGIIGGIFGGNGTTGRERNQVSILPRLKRINLNLLAHFTISDALEPFVEAKWNRIDALGNNAGPSFIQGTFNPFDIRERVRLDNPFLSPAERTTIANAILASGCNTSLTAACSAARTASSGSINIGSSPSQGIGGPLNAADIAAINAGTYRFVTARNLLDVGIRDEKFRRDTWRVVGGLRGTFNGDWNYEVSANYGRFDEDISVDGFVDKQRFMLAMDAGLDPATNTIRCRSQFVGTAAQNQFTRGVDPALTAARLAADIAACVPYNPFGFDPAANAASVQYFTYNARKKAWLTQLDFLGFVNGDSSQLFELPGGPISFALGAEYRKEDARYDDDDFAQTGLTNGVVIGEFDPPAFVVKEAFGELRVPILKDRHLVYDLELNGSARVSDYKGAVGTVWTWNYGGEWAPARGFRFRGNYGKSVRVPNLSETGFPNVFNFAPGFVDPCQTPVTGNRIANCQADFAALGVPFPLAPITRSLPIFSGSNPDLQPEVSHSLTLGAVFTPQVLPGFSVSADYYDIKVKNVIVSLSAQAIVNGCYDRAPGTTNVLCSLFIRVGPGGNSIGDLPGWVSGEQSNALTSAGQNFASRVRKGIDVNASYRTRFFRNWIVDTNLIYVHTIKQSDFQNPAFPTFENRLLEELGNPKDEFRLDTDVRIGKLTVGHRLHYIGPMYVNLFEDFNPLAGACVAGQDPNTCPPNDADWADIRQFPAVFYNDIRLQWDTGQMGVVKNVQIYAGIDNIFDRHPPLGTTATGAGSAIYDIRGRNYYAGIKARF